MSRIIYWNETDIVKETITSKKECKHKVNNICFNNNSKKLGKKCHGCIDYKKEDNKVEPYEY